MRTSLSGLSLDFKPNLSLLHQVFICSTYVLPQLRRFWYTFWTKLANKSSYMTSIGGMKLRLAKLQELNVKTWKIRAKELKKDLGKYVYVDRVLHYQGLLFMSEIT